MSAVLESGDVEVYEEDESFYQDVELLQNHGINVADIKKLKSAGTQRVTDPRSWLLMNLNINH